MRNSMIWLSGVDREVLAIFPGDRHKFASLGAVITVTGVLATVSMWFFLHTALRVNGVVAVPFALAWGAGIMSIDRMLVVSMQGRQKRWLNLLQAVPRLLLALLLGAVISTPLTLQIFAPEIDKQIQVIQQQNQAAFLRQLASTGIGKQITVLQQQIQNVNAASDKPSSADLSLASAIAALQKAQQKRTADYDAWQCQLYGGAACPPGTPAGNGPLARADQAAYETDQGIVAAEQAAVTADQKLSQGADKTSADQAATQIKQYESQLAADVKEEKQQIAAFNASNGRDSGLLIRLQALDQLTAGNSDLEAARWLLFALLATFEILPVLTKVLQNLGPESAYEKGVQKAGDERFRAYGKAWNDAHDQIVAELAAAEVRATRDSVRPSGNPKSASPERRRPGSPLAAKGRRGRKRRQAKAVPLTSAHPIPDIAGKILQEYRPGPATPNQNGQGAVAGQSTGPGGS
jgi:hypothetical protein